ncbi:MAG TPA: HAD hydrolase-like protein [Solirubrobacteraceae bacterium]|nr:HAD hydrolase-like protein [Solirubrobacteraceae bacterium]
MTALSPLLRAYDHVLLDLDGCVTVAGRPAPGAAEALSLLRAAGKRLAFVTNDSDLAPEEHVRRMWSMGLQASLAEIVTPGCALQFELAGREPGTPVFVIGPPAVVRHVADAGMRVVNGTVRAAGARIVVVVCHERLSYGELTIAVRALLDGAEMLAAVRDGLYSGPDGPLPATGAIVAALEYATGRRARIVGKPDALPYRVALDRLGPGRALVVGDRLDADLAGAAAAGLDGAIVLSGQTTREQAQSARDPAPVAVAETLHELVTG